jgi:hypothetical protein
VQRKRTAACEAWYLRVEKVKQEAEGDCIEPEDNESSCDSVPIRVQRGSHEFQNKKSREENYPCTDRATANASQS